MNNIIHDDRDLLATHDDLELAELSDFDEVTGGWTWTIPVTVGVSVAFCPTTKCTSQC